MLSKPTNPTPYMVAVDPSDGVTFRASCKNANEATGVRLCIKSNGYSYYFPNIAYTHDNDDIAVQINRNQRYNGYNIQDGTTNAARASEAKYICGSSANTPLLTNQKNYSWQLRLYQSAANVNIGYGFIQSVYSASSHNTFNSSTTHILKVRPHINMFFNTEADGVSSGFNRGVQKSLVNYYDDNVRYKIAINGTDYDVLAYYYCSQDKSFALQEEPYNDPLFAYIEIRSGSDEPAYKDDQYSIYTNYIDSNEFYFPCRANPTLTLYDCFGDRLNMFADSETPAEDNVVSIDYNEFKLTGSYSQSDGATVSYYRAALYLVSPDGETLINDTGNVYSSVISYTYDKFMVGETYKLVLQTEDTNKNSIVKSIYIKPDYPAETIADIVRIDYYKPHAALLLDFNDVVSISAHEDIDNAHTFGQITVDENGVLDDGNVALSELGNERISVNTCSVESSNNLTYKLIDGSDEVFKCVNPLLSITVHGYADGTQDVFDLTDDEGNKYKLSWQNSYFEYSYTISGRSGVQRYFPFANSGFTSVNAQTGNAAQIAQAIILKEKQYNVPYLALDDIVIADTNTSYWHTEDSFDDFWWQIILSKNYLYIKCLNSSHLGYLWEYERRW